MEVANFHLPYYFTTSNVWFDFGCYCYVYDTLSIKQIMNEFITNFFVQFVENGIYVKVHQS